MKKKPPFTLLVILSVVLVLLSFVITTNQSEWWSSALMSIGTSVITSILIIFAYDNILARQQDEKRRQREKIVLYNLGWKLRQHYIVLLNCYRSAADSAEPPKFKDIDEFLGPHYYSVVSHLDLFAASPANSDGSTTYIEYLQEAFEFLHIELSSLINNHGPDLSQEVFMATQNVLNNHFMFVTRQIIQIFAVMSDIPGFEQTKKIWFSGQQTILVRYCLDFRILVNSIERVYPQGLNEFRVQDWHNDFFEPGHARLS